ncbi:MAG TPA: 2-phospho-L-lactate transferase [Casimicrobiaceae bacterium]|nr:2-phospho-L-lactate transferase [Casimicrobiaceae bacterium]
MTRDSSGRPTVVVLAGGIGGAKLVLGLHHVLDAGALGVVANVGDDFLHLGLAICPDIDTQLYTLSGLADPVRGWGLRDETWQFMDALARLGGPTWFRLGDADLALHVERTRRMARGESLSAITGAFCERLGVGTALWPATDDAVRTRIRTAAGWLSFQEYFVEQRCEPAVEAVEYQGCSAARPCPRVLEALRNPALRAVIIAPSNPLLSIEPMLALPTLREELRRCHAPVIAVSPIIGDAAVKGPAAKMLQELRCRSDGLEAARRYADVIDGYVLDSRDAHLAPAAPVGVQVIATSILMTDLETKARLARECLAFADTLAPSIGVRAAAS